MKIATIHGPLQIGFDSQKTIPAYRDRRFNLARGRPGMPTPNVGDWFISRSAEKVLDYEEAVMIDLKTVTQSDWDYVNKECSALVLKGGNYISQNKLSSMLPFDHVKKIKIPIIFWGAGAQSMNGQFAIDDESREIVKYISSSAPISVRGKETEALLRENGIKDCIVTGCPSIFYSLNSSLKIKKPDNSHVLFTHRDYHFSDKRMVRELLKAIRIVKDKSIKSEIILQANDPITDQFYNIKKWGAEFYEEFKQIPNTGLKSAKKEKINIASVTSWYYAKWGISNLLLEDIGIFEWIIKNSFLSYDPEEYFDKFKSSGLVIGLRMHSNLLALAHGTPAFFITYDSRTRETADLFKIPNERLFLFNEKTDFLNANWENFEKRYAQLFLNFKKYLDSFGIKHKLK